MKKLFLLSLLILSSISLSVKAYDYDPLLMRAQASIFPKIILLDKNLDEKIKQDQVIITILYGKGEKKVAEEIKNLIHKQYLNNLGKKSLTVDVVAFDKFDQGNSSTAYFLLKGGESQRNMVTAHAASNKRLVFSYDYKDFQNNALVSVLMKEKTYIYLNKSAIHDYDIKFLPLFYKIVKVIE